MKWILASLMAISSFASSVEARPTRGIASASSNISDTVKKVREDDEGVVVMFEKTTGSYYLRRDVAEFDSLKGKLQDSLKNKKPVSVTVDSAQLNILEVK